MRFRKLRIAVFGLGGFWNVNKDKLRLYFNVVACSDNHAVPSEQWWRERFVHPDELVNIDFDYVLICTKDPIPEIRDQLEGYGIKAVIVSSPFTESLINVQPWLSNTCVGQQLEDRIYVIGDSHTHFFSGGNEFLCNALPFIPGVCVPYSYFENVTIFHIGPCLAYNIGKYNTSSRGREKIDLLRAMGLLPKGARVVCCFGEIDIRVYLLKQAEKLGIGYREEADMIVDEYVAYLMELSNDYDVYAWGPVAQTSGEGYGDQNYPIFGSEKDRNMATECFNSRLSEICRQHGIGFVSIFDRLIDEEYLTRNEYFRDPVHLNSSAWRFAKSRLTSEGLFPRWRDEDKNGMAYTQWNIAGDPHEE